MSPVNQYKNFEKKVASQVRRGVFGVFESVGSFLTKVFRVGRQNFTIMLIPHSEKRIFNFKISVFALLLIGLAATGILGAFFWYSTGFTGVNRALAQKSDTLEKAQANLEMMREEVGQLRRVVRMFENSLNTTLGIVGVDNPKPAQETIGKGDLASFLNLQQVEEGTLREVGDLRSLRVYLESAVEPLAQISNVLSSQKSLLVDIPTLWPLKGVRGWVTQPFGPAEHPFSGQWYLHKGLDIAQRIGTPIVATANGKVIKVDFEPNGFGNYVDIKHNYGFSTRYAHMSRVYVTKGQDMVRGQLIGALGSTGLSTGPHVHYEVRIGSQVVDPAKYLSISSSVLDQGSQE